MAAIGTFDYPDTTVDDAVEIAKKLASTFKSTEFGRDALAAALGYKAPNSGAFNQRLADLRKFGIVEGRGDSSRVTELARTLAAPRPGEYQEAIASLMFRVPLYKALHDHYKGAAPGEDDFFATLLNLTKADRIDVQNQAGKIRSLYAAGSNLIGSRPAQSAPPTPDTQASNPAPGGAAPPPPSADVHLYKEGSIYLVIPKDLDALETARDMIDVWIKRASKKPL